MGHRKMHQADPGVFLGVYFGAEHNSNGCRMWTTSGSMANAVALTRLTFGEQWKLELAHHLKCNPWRLGGVRDGADNAKVAVDGG